jgi:RNA polymerase sigma-70 factor (ECF subfamily)
MTRGSIKSEVGPAAAGMGANDAGQMLAVLYERGRSAHPRILVSQQAFGEHLARHATEGITETLAALAIDDLYLACASAVGARGAAAAFQRRFTPVIRRAVSRVLTTADERQEAEQRVWQSLMTDTAEPRIATYDGRGSLDKWVSVASMRIAISLGRSESAERRLRDKAFVEATGVPPDAPALNDGIRAAFEAAVSAAIARLNAREGLILKLYLVSGMTLDAIGKSLGVTRQAVAKTLSRSRRKIVSRVEASVQGHPSVTDADVASVLRCAASQLESSRMPASWRGSGEPAHGRRPVP